MKAEELEKALSRGDISPLYYFYGNEPYLVERGVKRLLSRVVVPEFQDFNFNVFYGNECRGGEIVELAQTLPMFSPWRVVLVKRSGDLPAAALEILSEYVSAPSPSTCLIFQGDKIDQRKKFFVEMKKRGELIEFKRPYENQLAPFIREEAAAFGKKFEAAAIDFLVHLVGNNLQELAAQMEKTVTYVGKRDSVTLADVKAVVSDTKVDSVFDLANALGEKNLGKGLRHLHTILRDGEAPLMVLAMLTRHFRQLWRVREFLDARTPPQEIGKLTGINPYFLKGVLEQARNFRVSELKRVFELLYGTDLALKSSGGKPGAVMERLLLDICGSR
ncbi:MAG TPA: DNA polymerase III subunit delta [Geobacteraceae bacterium]